MHSRISKPIYSALRQTKNIIFFWQLKNTKIEPEPSLRAELFSAEQMEKHGLKLAEKHQLSSIRKPVKLLDRLQQNEHLFKECCKYFFDVTCAPHANQPLTPAGEWLMDNHWLLEEQILETRKNMPKGYIEHLPQLTQESGLKNPATALHLTPKASYLGVNLSDHYVGNPRIYDLALEHISHSDGHLDMQILARFISAYQSISPLTLGELWALPLMLRLALIENLRRVSTRIMAAWVDQNLALKWADQLINSVDKKKKSVLLAVAEMAASHPPMSSAFVAELARRLQGQNTALSLPLTWIEETLNPFGLSIDQLVQQDAQLQAADQVSVSNSLNSLRLLSAKNWRNFVEQASLVEKIFNTDPAQIYPQMDFRTRDHYRHQVEQLARKFNLPEEVVAQKAIDLAQTASKYLHKNSEKKLYSAALNVYTGNPQTQAASELSLYLISNLGLEQTPAQKINTKTHVGFYLIDKGLLSLKKLLEGGAVSAQKNKEINEPSTHKEVSLALYLAFSLGLTVLFTWPFFNLLQQNSWSNFALVLSLIPILIVVSQLTIKLVNWQAGMLVSPNFLARLDFSKGISSENRTLVVIPTLLNSEDDVKKLADKLEVHFLANRDENLQFGLLTDFKDAQQEKLPEDAHILQLAQQAINALNAKYPNPQLDSFFLCHRPRLWNAGEGVWMGYERKRGKLSEFNALLQGKGRERFMLIVGNTLNGPNHNDVPPEAISSQNSKFTPVRYVITLDADTQLPRNAAMQMVGSMAHPLNQPVYDPQKKQVISGYAIMQPRVGVSIGSANHSSYAKLFCTKPGIDPYTLHVSDLYQDLFRQGSFVGKGIYEVNSFEQAVNGRFPENNILSHDLIEGCFARSALLSDVILIEDFPTTYLGDVQRRHRWIRGDWQLLAWLLPFVPTASGKWESNPLSALSLWKILDNLRRSLVSPALLIFLALGWLATKQPIFWTLAILSLIYALPVFDFIINILNRPKGLSYKLHLEEALENLFTQAIRSTFMLVCVPFEAYYSLDAILRTLWRVIFSKKHRLQWNPSANAEQSSPRTLLSVIKKMCISPLWAIAISCMVLLYNPIAAIPAILFSSLWFLSPFVAWKVGKPKIRKKFEPSSEQKTFLHMLSRKTWGFFEHHVCAEDNWLPPDNIQEQPGPVVAHRTSSTNMGLSLLAHLSAYDFGYLSASALLDRLGKSFASMSKLKREHNHFYNWYNTKTLEPLHPRYISTVDSGNLAGHLLTLRAGLLQLPDEPIFSCRIFDGIIDTINVLMSELTYEPSTHKAWQKLKKTALKSCTHEINTLDQALAVFEELRILAEKLNQPDVLKSGSEAAFWAKALFAQLDDYYTHFNSLLLPKGSAEEDSCLKMPSLAQLAKINIADFSEELRQQAGKVKLRANSLIKQSAQLAAMAANFAEMDFKFLYNPERKFLAIGFNVEENKLDKNYYDLLASEARLAYFVAISQGQIPQDSWFNLGRLLTSKGRRSVLLSWAGSMFEYLMPNLIMPSFEGTLLDDTCHGAVDIQIDYGRKINLPWGISESAFNLFDSQYNYQYQAFGVPGLGLKRGLSEDYVIAPYASMLALITSPAKACANLQKLALAGMSGRFGLYEAVDHTPMRIPSGKKAAIIHSFMAHHQGMSLLALQHFLLNQSVHSSGHSSGQNSGQNSGQSSGQNSAQNSAQNSMQKRFASEPLFKSSLLLLEERSVKSNADNLYTCNHFACPVKKRNRQVKEDKLRIYKNPYNEFPVVQLLSNGRYHVMVSGSGSGYSRYQDMAITRWQEDSTRENWGQFCYIRDCKSGEYWSSTLQPSLKKADSYEAIFCDAKAEFKVRKNDLELHTEIVVSPEDDVELRYLHIKNRSSEKRSLELTSYMEVVLAEMQKDALHPAFSKLFVQSELQKELQAIICHRRPNIEKKGISPAKPYMFHLLSAHGVNINNLSYETDRARFIGRGRTLVNPVVMDLNTNKNLSNTCGPVLDPIAAIRCQINLEPGQTISVLLASGVGENHESCIELIKKFRNQHLAQRVYELAWTHCHVQLHQFNASSLEAHLYEKMAASIIYPNAEFRANSSIIEGNTQNQSRLWAHGISGDLPIVLLRISNTANFEIVAQLIKAHTYWRLKGLKTDLVIWNEDDFSYRQTLHDQIISMIPSGTEQIMDNAGGIFILAAQQLSREEQIMIQASARLTISDSGGSLSEQLYRQAPKETAYPLCPFINANQKPQAEETQTEYNPNWQNNLILSSQGNAYGGFSSDGREYVIQLKDKENLPAPWVNVLSNPNFGCVVSESGSSYTWRNNAQQFRLTPWENDPVCDSSGEAFYLRDEESGKYWSPSPWPCRGKGNYTIQHGFGYSIFKHQECDIESQLTVFVAKDEPLKFWKFKLFNHSKHQRHLSITGYVEWVLGDLRPKHAMHIATKTDRNTGAIFARNPYNLDYSEQVAFFDVDLPNRSISGNRAEFIGRNRNLTQPAAMERTCLSGHTGVALDPCGAIQSHFTLAPESELELVFVLGCTNSQEESVELNKQYSNLKAAKSQLLKVQEHWSETLSQIQVKTPDPALNVLANGWLMYQTIACRFQARSGFYQSGGAFGFRDQLQDCLAIMHPCPQLVREHIITSAGRQFVEGDVLHWWHSPLNRGVRTRCSDDYLWLPTVVASYIEHTGDYQILDEEIAYIESRTLNPEEESFYHLPMPSHLTETLYQHCIRAIKKGLLRGENGLPLMEGGDWNDSMNLVGAEGKGESVWLGFFQYKLLHNFAKIASQRGDEYMTKRCKKECEALRENLEFFGWDGEWYKRAYFDDGTPLGSKQNQECFIDSIAQSWSVISGAAPEWHQKKAMQSLDEKLVRRDIGIIQLLQPPFDTSPLEPGYIKGYLPGVRENGGQYTHAAIWAVMAFAMLGEREKTWELFNLINPVHKGKNKESANVYKVEPYVMSADVYSVQANKLDKDINGMAGRGGWSWLTGASGWMYKLIIEYLLGVKVQGEYITIEPLMPDHWLEFSLNYRYKDSNYQITVHQIATPNNDDKERIIVDGQSQPGTSFKLVNDENRHEVVVYCKNKQKQES